MDAQAEGCDGLSARGVATGGDPDSVRGGIRSGRHDHEALPQSSRHADDQRGPDGTPHEAVRGQVDTGYEVGPDAHQGSLSIAGIALSHVPLGSTKAVDEPGAVA